MKAALFLMAAAIVLSAPAVSPVALAATTSGAIGCVDFNRALNEVADGRRAKQRLQSEFQEKQRQLERLKEELRQSKDHLDRDRLLISEDALRQREAEYQRGFAALEERLSAFRAEMSEKERQYTQEILDRLRQIVRDIGRDEGFDLILERSQDVVLYAPEGRDLTERVIAIYDRSRGAKK